MIAPTLVLMTVALLAVSGLVFDGGVCLAARARAHDLATQAARAGADELNPQSLRGPNPQALSIDPTAARAAATQFLVSGDATGVITIAGQDVTVTAHVRRHATILAAFGLHDMSASATATATFLHGTTQGKP